MKYSLSNLLLLTALIAALMGWFYDHRRLNFDKERLNTEAANLLSTFAARHNPGRVVQPGEITPRRTYNFSIEQDRADWLSDNRSPFILWPHPNRFRHE